MQINIQELSQIGKRQNNEDSILSSPQNGLFTVCDGVGGNNKGEVASNIACNIIINSLKQYSNIELSQIGITLQQVEKEFENYIKNNPESAGMATTLAMLQLTDTRATIVHIGDSRVYHIRNGKILFQTEDHSLVNELVASGYITIEEAKVHPKKNQITRALQVSKESALADVDIFSNILPNDYFFLCTDGILESIDNEFIEKEFVVEADCENIIQKISSLCLENSNDNYSAILIKVVDFNDSFCNIK